MSDFRASGDLRDVVRAEVGPWTTPDQTGVIRTVLESASELIGRIDELTSRSDSSRPLIVRDPDARANQLGLLAIDVSGVPCMDTAAIN